MQKTCIIIPCYNEEHRLQVLQFAEYIYAHPYHFCFVNDGSLDNTLSKLKEIKTLCPEKVLIIDLKSNKGKAEAVRTGILHAHMSQDFEILGFLDADLSTPLNEIKYLLSHFDEPTQIIIGSRVRLMGANITRNIYRHYSGRIFVTFANLILGFKVYDSQCGAKFFHRDTIPNLFRKPFKTKWLFDLEILKRYYHANSDYFGKTVKEIPLKEWHEKNQSKLTFRDYLKAPFEIILIKKG